jgi:hypothetical protein
MPTAYEIGVNIKLVDQATPALRILIRTLNTAQEAADRLKVALAEVANVKFSGTTRSLTGLDRGLAKIGDAATVAGDRMVAATDRMIAGVTALDERLAQTAAEIRGIAASSRGLRFPGAMPGKRRCRWRAWRRGWWSPRPDACRPCGRALRRRRGRCCRARARLRNV